MIGWKVSTLAEVADIGAGNSAPQDERLFKDGVYPFVRTSDVGQIRFGLITTTADQLNEVGIEGLRLFQKGTILMPKSGASTFLNYRVEMAVDGYVSSHLATVRARPDVCDGGFLLYYLSTVRAQDLIQDHKYPSLTLGAIGQIPVPLPPLDEQKRIVGRLGYAFDAIAIARSNAEANLVDAGELFSRELDLIFSVEGHAWPRKRFEDLLQDALIGITRNSREQGTNLQYSYVKMHNITPDNRFDFSKSTRVDASREEVQRFALQPGDFLFNTRNSHDLVGKSCVYPGENGVVLFNNNIMRIRFEVGIDSNFVLAAFSSREVRREIESLKSGTTNVSAIYYKDLRNLRVPVPSEHQQRRIVARLATLRAEVSQLQAAYTQKLSALDEMRQSLLQAAFAGQLN